jgi:hypothetical protein
MVAHGASHVVDVILLLLAVQVTIQLISKEKCQYRNNLLNKPKNCTLTNSSDCATTDNNERHHGAHHHLAFGIQIRHMA